jgi:hypothetical protein
MHTSFNYHSALIEHPSWKELHLCPQFGCKDVHNLLHVHRHISVKHHQGQAHQPILTHGQAWDQDINCE